MMTELVRVTFKFSTCIHEKEEGTRLAKTCAMVFPKSGMEKVRITHIQGTKCSKISLACKCHNQKGERVQDNWKQLVIVYSFSVLHCFHLTCLFLALKP